ncbi:MAG: adenylate/guanylate cyclase domain-containing protein [Solirubrobacterales bacterium]|nr:adenylate/guanylate cyclase domain-containing protein [Solirubrobacterales bacterium]
MVRPLRFLWRVLGRRYPRVVIALWYQTAFLVALGGVGLLTLYQDMSAGEFWTIVAVAEALTLTEILLATTVAFRLLRPADPWLRGGRRPEDAPAAWAALVSLPLRALSYRWFFAVPVNLVPIAVVITWFLDLEWYSVAILVGGSAVVVAYGVLLRFFGLELVLRPVLEQVARDLPARARVEGTRVVPVRWRLLVALPAINVITGVVVSALSTTGSAELADLGFDVVVAVVVAFTLSLELSILLSRSILGPLGDLRRATEEVARGDLTVRVPVLSTDETGRLSGAFNDMVAGLEEREALREAFGSYVDPELADRVLTEGAVLEGQEVEVSVLFLDIRDFTAFAERSTATEVVAELNGFFEVVVPVLVAHGGHANKFIGDGLLGVFGAPDRREDHADRAVCAALEMATRVRETYRGRLRIGIGVNSGPVVSGTVGGGGRLEFTVIGDPVNTAARVEQLTRETGDDLLITEATRVLLTRAPVGFEPRGTVALKGKSERVEVHAPVISATRAGADRAVPPATALGS